MEKADFKHWMAFLEDLNRRQQRQLQEKFAGILARKRVSRYLETPSKELVCPHCGSKSIVRWGTRNDMQRYRCKQCKRTFNSLTGTPLAYLHRKGHWLDYAQCIKEGLSVRKAASKCGIHRNTSFRWRHRFLERTRDIKPDKLQGIVEANETFFRRSEKGNQKLLRKAHKRGIRPNREISVSQKVFVFISQDRHQNVFDGILEKFKLALLRQLVEGHLAKDALFCSKNAYIYRQFARKNNVRHGFLDMEHGETVKKDIVHIRNVKSYSDRLRNWIVFHFRGVATKYLENYLAWHRELDEFKGQIEPLVILLRAKNGGAYKNQPNCVTQPESLSDALINPPNSLALSP